MPRLTVVTLSLTAYAAVNELWPLVVVCMVAALAMGVREAGRV